jgi:hypothetical protein
MVTPVSVRSIYVFLTVYLGRRFRTGAVTQSGVDRKESHARQSCRQALEKSVLLVPGDRVGRPARLGQPRDQWRQYPVEPGTSVVVAIGTRRAIEDGAYDLGRSIERRGAPTFGQSLLDEGSQRTVMDLVRFDVREMLEE